MSVAADSILRVVASMLWDDGNVVQNVFNAKVSGGGAPWDDQDIIDDAIAWLDNMYLNITTYVSDHQDGNEGIVYKYDAVGLDWDEVGSDAWTWNPSQSADYTARAVAGLVRLWTEDADVQGKKYIAGLAEPQMTDGLWDSAVITALLAFAADWYNPFTGSVSGASWVPGIWSVKNLVFKAGVDHVATTTIPAYQRRRKRNVGI